MVLFLLVAGGVQFIRLHSAETVAGAGMSQNGSTHMSSALAGVAEMSTGGWASVTKASDMGLGLRKSESKSFQAP